jgi:hypothetical protein
MKQAPENEMNVESGCANQAKSGQNNEYRSSMKGK